MCLFHSPESLGLTKSQVLKSAETTFAKRMFAFQSDDWEGTEKFKTCLEECASGKTDKSYRSMLAVASGLGNGKSRFLHELVGLAKETVDLSRFNTVELRVSFEEESGTGLRDDELRGEDYLVADKILLDRLLFRMLASDGDSFDTFRRENQWGFSFDWLVPHIKTMFKEEKKDAMVFLLIDGIDNLPRYSKDSKSKTARSILSSVLHDVTRIITSSPFSFVAYTCTELTPVLMARWQGGWITCSVNAMAVGPPVLTRLPDEVTNEVVVEHKEQFVEMFGAHPRSMEVLVSSTGRTVAEVFDAAVDAVRDRYNIRSYLTAEQLLDLLHYALRPRECLSDGRDFPLSVISDGGNEPFLQNGLLRIHRGRVAVSPLYLMMELQHEISRQADAKGSDASGEGHPLLGWQPFESDFETNVAWVRCLRSRVFKGEFRIQYMYPGVQWVSPRPSTKIVTAPLELCAAAHEVHTASNMKARAISASGKSRAWQVATSAGARRVDPVRSCIVNARGAPAGAVFSSVKTPGGTRFNEVIQTGAWLGGKGELPLGEVLKNAEVSASSGDVYLLVTRNAVADADLERLKDATRDGVHVGVVHSENFNEYFGPFAGTFLRQASMRTLSVHLQSLPPPPGTDSSPPTKSVLRSWAPGRWNPVRAPAVQQAWVPRQVPTAVTPRSTVNALLLRRARCAAKLFA